MKNNQFVLLVNTKGEAICGPCEVVAYHDDTVRVKDERGKIIAWSAEWVKKIINYTSPGSSAG